MNAVLAGAIQQQLVPGNVPAILSQPYSCDLQRFAEDLVLALRPLFIALVDRFVSDDTNSFNIHEKFWNEVLE